MGRRVTLKDIAAQCGVSVAAVSYALRENPRIPACTRLAIRRVADQLGYRPDPFLSALVSYRADARVQRLIGEVAVLYPCERNSPHTFLFRFHRQCFGERIAEHGFSASDIYLGELAWSTRRLRQILDARNIRGLVLAWGFEPGILAELPWHEFVAVSTEREIVNPHVDRISVNHFCSVHNAMEKMWAKGYRRIGLIYHDDAPRVVKRNLLGSYLVETEGTGRPNSRLEAFEYRRGESPSRFVRWLRENKPDALLSHRRIEPSFFKEIGVTFPRDLGYAVAEIDDARPGVESGVYIAETMGRTLATMLANKIAAYDNVSSSHEGQLLLVNGVWHDGVTL